MVCCRRDAHRAAVSMGGDEGKEECMRRRGIAWGIGLAVLLGLVPIARDERHAVLIGVD